MSARADASSPLALDSEGMWRATLGFPEQLRAAVRAASACGPLPDGPAISNIVVLGMGGSGIAGDLLAAIAGPELVVPVTVVKSYEAPAFVGPDTLVFAVSFSGETEETLSAAGQALDAGANVVAVAGGGRLAELVGGAGGTVIPVPGDIPQPRAALAAMGAPPLIVLERLGFLAGAAQRLGAAAEQLERRRDELLVAQSEAAEVARRLERTFPLVHGSPGTVAVAAQRWKTQMNENAKTPAFWASQPELCHNEVAGWGLDGDVTRQVLTLVSLRHRAEHPQVAKRSALVAELMLEVVADVIEVWARGEDDLARFFDLALVGDVVSLLVADRQGVDPGPVPVLGEIKQRLAR